MTRIVVTGAAGQLGRDLLATTWPTGWSIHGLTRADLDVTDREGVLETLDRLRPDLIVNAAAYTGVDAAEDEPELAAAVNAEAVGHLARWADAAAARLIHISTDYVFDGSKDGWYVEDDPIAPLGVYGTTKAAGEDRARDCTRHLILRTAWVYGVHGANFVKTMRRVAADRDELRVVADQIGCPTSTADLAGAIATLAAEPRASETTGTFHVAGSTEATWHEFAQAILADRIAEGLVVHAITTAEYPTPARRPANSRLDSSAIERVAGVRLRSWQDALHDVLADLDEVESR